MKKRVLSLLLALSLVLTGVGIAPAQAAEGGGLVITPVEPEEIPVEAIRPDNLIQLPEEDPEEIVDVIVVLSEQPVADQISLSAYGLENASIQQAAVEARASLEAQQSLVQSRMLRTLGVSQVTTTYSYTMLLNGFAVKTARRNLSAIQNTPGVEKAYVASYYRLPETQASVESTRVALADAGTGYTGTGAIIAVLDTGLDTGHSAFSHEPEGQNLTRDRVSTALAYGSLKAASMVSGLSVDDVYVSGKVPFAFDYGEGDATVAPINKTQAVNLEHGTHVAGICAGYDVDEEGQVTFSGVAPDAQVVAMKVFDDTGAGASTANILAALEDAYVLGVDAVNLSLGSRCGYTVDDDETINEVYGRLRNAGVMVIVAAGNDTSASVNNTYGLNQPLTDDPDNSIVSSPSTYVGNLSVASVESDSLYTHYFEVDGEKVCFTDGTSSWLGVPNYVDYRVGSGELKERPEFPYAYVMVPGYGAFADYNGVDVTGKIAVVQRGGMLYGDTPLTFANKAFYANRNGAIGVIVYNNDTENPDDFSVHMDTSSYMIPACFVSYNMGQLLAEKAETGRITIVDDFLKEENPAGGQMSSFTSIGVTPDLRLKPEISGIGGNVYSSIPTLAGQGSYTTMSGTSMASPYVAGASLLVSQRIRDDWPVNLAAAEVSTLTENLLMSTAQIVTDPDTGLPYTPRLQGSGLMDLNSALTSSVCLYTDADEYSDSRPVANLGDDVARSGSYTVSFHARNYGSEAIRYNVDVVAMSPDVIYHNGNQLMSDKDVALDFTLSGPTSIECAPGGTTNVSLTINLTSAQKAELDRNFIYGIFVEGFVRLTPVDSGAEPTLSVPFVAFYGDWSEPGMMDYATMLNDKVVPYSLNPTMIGTWYSSASVKLGGNLSTNEYVPIVAQHCIISPNGDEKMDGVEIVSLGLLRDASMVRYTVTDAAGDVVWTSERANVPKTTYYASQGAVISATQFLEFAATPWFGVDNEGNALEDGQYYYTIEAEPVTGHESANVRNSVTFPVYIDTVAPTLKSGNISLRTTEDGKLMATLPFEDDHIFLDASIYPLYSNGTVNYLRPIARFNYGLDGMPDIQTAQAEVDLTAYAGQTVYLQLADWGYNTTAYYIYVPASIPENIFTLSYDNLFLFTDTTESLYVYNTLGEEADMDLTWTSSDTSVATVSGDGTVYGVAPGVATVTATAPSGASASCVVGVEDMFEYTGIRLDYDEFTVPVAFNTLIRLPSVYVEPYDFEVPVSEVTWTASDDTIIGNWSNVDKKTLTVEGDVTLTAEYRGMTASFDVHVYENTGSMDMYRKWITPGANKVFTQGYASVVSVGRDAIYPYDKAADSDDQIITFTYDNHDVISLDKTTASATANKEATSDHTFVTALYPGTATITATATDTTQDTISWMITVKAKRYDGIDVTQSSIALCVGSEDNASRYLTLLGENVLPEFNPVQYTSFAPEIVSVDETGALTAHAPGTGLIRAMLNTGDYTLLAVQVSEHDLDISGAQEPTCTESGWSGDAYCRICGELVWANHFLPALGHSPEVVGRVEATPYESGYTGDLVCSVCHELISYGKIIPPTGGAIFPPYPIDPTPSPTPSQPSRPSAPSAPVEPEPVDPEPVDPTPVTPVDPGYTWHSPFADVADGAWYYDAVQYVRQNGLMNGVSDSAFAPDAQLSRAMLTQILYNMEGKPSTSGSNTFTDVASGAWYKDAVAWAAASFLVQGFDDGTFRPDNAITREQLAVILYRYAISRGYDVNATASLAGYADVSSVSSYAVEAMQWAVGAGLIGGVTTTTLVPQGPATRAQIALILMNFCQKIAG